MNKSFVSKKIISILAMMLLSSQVLGTSIVYTQTNPNAVPACHKLEDNKLSMMTQIQLQRQICLYENYAKISDKWSSVPPKPIVPLGSVVIDRSSPESSEALKQSFTNSSNGCRELATSLKATLKTMYGVEDFKCR